MRNLWIFISKYNAFFLFILYFSLAFLLVVRNNAYQRAGSINSANRVVAYFYGHYSDLTGYLNLAETNRALADENARLRGELEVSKFHNDTTQGQIIDTVSQQRYTYIVAQVIKNSIHQKNNIITINRGSRHGIHKGMGVLSPTGVAGIVLQVSEHFATVQSLLHSDTRISASLQKSMAFGSLVWGENNFNPRMAYLDDIPNHVKVNKSEPVVTSGYSLFPPGIPVGHVISATSKGGKSFLEIPIALTTDFARLQIVYVVKDDFAEEKQQLEEASTDG